MPDFYSVDSQLSVVLPVHNAQSSLLRRVSDLIDVVDDVTDRFEIIVVDDGSTDHTEEIAFELSRSYPQVRLLRHHRSLGEEVAAETGVVASHSEYVVVLPERAAISAEQIRWCWQMRKNEFVDAAAAEPRGQANSLVHRLMRWADGVAAAEKESASDQPVRFLRRTRVSAIGREQHTRRQAAAPVYERRDVPSTTAAPAPPRFLQRLREFALGE